jgi:raffinose/stachyose/melibiose transport system permease protein
MSRLDLPIHYVILSVFLLAVLYPLLGILGLALDPRANFASGLQIPTALSLDTILRAWRFAHMGIALRNSAIVAGSVTIGCLALSTLAGYAFGTMRIPAGNIIFNLFLLGLVVPLEVYIIPLYYQLQSESLLDSFPGLILPLLARSLPFGVFWMRASFLAMPRSLVEAARIDGASTFGILRFIHIPLLRPALTTLTVLTFVFAWSSFLLPLVVVTTDQMQTATLSLALFIGKFTTDTAGLAAGTLMISLPTVLVFVVFQRQLIRGILAGAVKE